MLRRFGMLCTVRLNATEPYVLPTSERVSAMRGQPLKHLASSPKASSTNTKHWRTSSCCCITAVNRIPYYCLFVGTLSI